MTTNHTKIVASLNMALMVPRSRNFNTDATSFDKEHLGPKGRWNCCHVVLPKTPLIRQSQPFTVYVPMNRDIAHPYFDRK